MSNYETDWYSSAGRYFSPDGCNANKVWSGVPNNVYSVRALDEIGKHGRTIGFHCLLIVVAAARIYNKTRVTFIGYSIPCNVTRHRTHIYIYNRIEFCGK